MIIFKHEICIILYMKKQKETPFSCSQGFFEAYERHQGKENPILS